MIASTATCAKCGFALDSSKWGRCSRCLADALLRFHGVPSDSSTEPLATLGDYELREEIARGGMGVVFRARQISLDREVAVKLLRESWLASEEDIRRFRAEAAAAAKLRHANIVAIYEVGEQNGQHFFAMDLVDGMNLAQATAAGPLPARQAAEIVRTVADAVQCAHEGGLLHRDLKPSNVLLDAEGKPFVTDFGLARAFDLDSSLTVTGQVLGTPGYMAPEQATGRAVGPEADIYALGALLYHLLTSRPPFTGGSAVETLKHVTEAEPVAPQLINPAVPRDLASVCLKCLAKRTTERYASAADLAADLQRFLAGEPTRARPANGAERAWRWCQRRPALATALGCAALAVGVGFAGILWQWRRAEQHRAVAERNELTARQGLYAADMNLVQRTLAQQDMGGARKLLRAHEPGPGQPDLRGWEWWYFSTLTRGRNAFTVEREGTIAKFTIPSPHLNGLIVAWSDGLIELRDFASGQTLTPLFKTDDEITSLVSDAEGRWLAASFRNQPGKLWDISDSMNPAFLRNLPAKLRFTSLSSERNLLSAGVVRPFVPYDDQDGDTGTTAIVDYTTGNELRTLPESGLFSRFSRDGRTLITGSWKGSVKVWNTEDWTLKHTLSRTGTVINMAISPDGRYLVTANWDGAALLWDLTTGRRVGEFEGHSSRVWSIRFSPDGRTLATGSGDQTIALWDFASRRELARLHGHTSELRGMAFSPDGKWLASHEPKSSTIRFWRTGPTDDAAQTNAALRMFGPPVFSPNGRVVAVANERNTVTLWDATTGQQRAVITAEPNPVAFTADADQLVTASVTTPLPLHPGTISGLKYWNVKSGELERSIAFSPSNQVAAAAALSPDGKTLVTGDSSTHVSLWDLKAGTVRDKLETGSLNRVWRVVYSPDGRMLAVGAGGSVRVWQLETKRVLLQTEASGLPVAFSPDGETLATGRGQEIDLWTLATGKRLDTLRGHREGLYWLAFSRDGRTLASACEDIKLWNVATRREVASFRQDAPFLYVGFSPNGRSLLAGRIGQGTIWNAEMPGMPE